MSYIIPKHVQQHTGMNSRQWKAWKRRQLKRIQREFEAFQPGCAFVNGYWDHVVPMGKALEGLKKSMSVKEWGR